MSQNNIAEMQELAQKICSFSREVETEVMIFKNKSALTRYADNYIHQNVSDTSYHIRIRTIIGKKTATATTNNLDDSSLKQTLQAAIDATKMQKDNDKLLPLPKQQKYQKVNNFCKATDEFTPQQRAESITKAVNICKKNNLFFLAQVKRCVSDSQGSKPLYLCRSFFGFGCQLLFLSSPHQSPIRFKVF